MSKSILINCNNLLNFHLIRISEDDYQKCLKEVQLPNMNIRFSDEKIAVLQRKLEDLLSDDDELRMKASKGKLL